LGALRSRHRIRFRNRKRFKAGNFLEKNCHDYFTRIAVFKQNQLYLYKKAKIFYQIITLTPDLNNGSNTYGSKVCTMCALYLTLLLQTECRKKVDLWTAIFIGLIFA
jgi:hypothetical protein